jgi:hypothetical protein
MQSTAASLEALLKSRERSDVTVWVEGHAFHLHSWLLRLRSPFFNAQLEESSNWKETQEDAVVLQDSHSTFTLLLPYLYTEKLDWKIHEDRPHVETWEDLVKVSVLAQFLQVDDLKEHLRSGKECESSGFSTLLEKEIRKFIKFTPNPHNRSQMLAEINDIDAMEAFIKTTSDDAFLLGMIDEHFKAMTFQVQFSRLTAQALHLLLIAEKYSLPALTQRMQTHCTTKSRGSNRFNDAFTEAIVRAAAKKWGGQRVLAVVCKVYDSIPNSLSDDLGTACANLDGAAQTAEGVRGPAKAALLTLAASVRTEAGNLRQAREAADEQAARMKVMARVYQIVDELRRGPEVVNLTEPVIEKDPDAKAVKRPRVDSIPEGWNPFRRG